MKTSKIVILIAVFVFFSFLHVFLQTEIIKLGYEVKKNEDKFQELVDNNHVLKYNIYALESPYSLDRRVLLRDSSLKVLRPVQVLGLYTETSPGFIEVDRRSKSLFKGPVFLAVKKFFTGKQAEAKTIK
ncbi:hypothetical protein ACFL2J_00565 [Candidatus Omnitrophota bacterium]